MNKYQIQTEGTAKPLPFVSYSDYFRQAPRLENISWRLLSAILSKEQQSVALPWSKAQSHDAPGYRTHATAFTSERSGLIPLPLTEPLLPTVAPYQGQARLASFTAPHHGLLQLNKATASAPAGSANTFTIHSSSTQPTVNTVFVSSVEDPTTSNIDLIVELALNAAVLKQAEDWFAKARQAARAGNLRTAYHGVYRAFDLLLRSAKWDQVSAELEEICSDKYPIAFGIGAMRFVSSAAESIPNWNFILRRFMGLAQHQNVDVRKAFRGLPEANGAK